MAFISGSVNIDNQKIIEAKMDELITDQIMDSDITSREIQYDEVLSYVSNCIQDSDFLKEWFSISNNLIGFSSAMPLSYKTIKEVTVEEISASLKTFESAFSSINVSKIKLGMARRRMVKYFFEKYQKLSNLDEHPLLDKISVEL
jgi:hypothetical protein